MALTSHQEESPHWMVLPAIPGLNVEEGLRRTGGDEGLYARILRQFVSRHASAADLIRESLERGDVRTAERVAHSLKGVCGNIGAVAMPAVASELEKAIRTSASAEHVEVLRTKLASELGALVASIEPLLQRSVETHDRPVSPLLDRAAALVVVEKLTALLEEFDPAAATCVESERQTLRMLLTAERFRELERLVNAYSFEEAIALLRSASQT